MAVISNEPHVSGLTSHLHTSPFQNAKWVLSACVEGGQQGEGVLVLRLAPSPSNANPEESEMLPQRDVVMLMDASGSMMGEWAAVAREAAVIVDALPAGVAFTAVAFSDTPQCIVQRAVLGSAVHDRSSVRAALALFVPPFSGTRMGRAVHFAKSLLCDELEPPAPSLLPRTEAAGSSLKPPPVIFLATDGQSMDTVDLAELQQSVPHVTVHVAAYTAYPDASVLGQLASATGGSYLYCPTASAAGTNAALAAQRARQVLSAQATPLKTAVLSVAGPDAGAPLSPRFMDLTRPLRLVPYDEVRLPFACDSAAKFLLSAQCLDDSQLTCEAVYDPASPPLRTAAALSELGRARAASAARASAGGDRLALQAFLQSAQAAAQAATQANDEALIAATAETLLLAEDLCAEGQGAPSVLHLAERLTSCSQGGSTSGGDPEKLARLASGIALSLSQAPADLTQVDPDATQVDSDAAQVDPFTTLHDDSDILTQADLPPSPPLQYTTFGVDALPPAMLGPSRIPLTQSAGGGTPKRKRLLE